MSEETTELEHLADLAWNEWLIRNPEAVMLTQQHLLKMVFKFGWLRGYERRLEEEP